MTSRENPFPGMNPYLERRWGDVHAALSTYARDSLQDQLPEDLRARMQERDFIESTDEILPFPRRGFSPDVHVYEIPATRQEAGQTRANSALTVEPIIIQLPDAETTESYLEIIDINSGGRVVTTLEFVSRSNKRPGPGRKDYLRKRSETIKAGENIVEIDLLRTGRHVTSRWQVRIVSPRKLERRITPVCFEPPSLTNSNITLRHCACVYRPFEFRCGRLTKTFFLICNRSSTRRISKVVTMTSTTASRSIHRFPPKTRPGRRI